MTIGRRARRLVRRVTGGGPRLDRTTTRPPVFVGGTGRTGTTVTARVIGAHPASDPAMRASFDAWVTEDRAHLGRWATDVPAERRGAFEAHDRRLAEASDADTEQRRRQGAGSESGTQGSAA